MRAFQTLLIAAFLSLTVSVSAWSSTSMWTDMAKRFIDSPGDIFMNLHTDNEDFSPVPEGSRGAVRFNFFPTFMPLSWANLNLKVNVLGERSILPQVDLVGMYGDILAVHALRDQLKDKPEFSDYSVGAVFTKTASKDVRLFGGLKYSAVRMKVKFEKPVVLVEDKNTDDAGTDDFTIDHIDFNLAETFLFTGLMHSDTPDKYMSAQIGYGFNYKKIVSRIMMGYRHLELGVDVYPEGLLVLHPFMAWHWYF